MKAGGGGEGSGSVGGGSGGVNERTETRGKVIMQSRRIVIGRFLGKGRSAKSRRYASFSLGTAGGRGGVGCDVPRVGWGVTRVGCGVTRVGRE